MKSNPETDKVAARFSENRQSTKLPSNFKIFIIFLLPKFFSHNLNKNSCSWSILNRTQKKAKISISKIFFLNFWKKIFFFLWDQFSKYFIFKSICPNVALVPPKFAKFSKLFKNKNINVIICLFPWKNVIIPNYKQNLWNQILKQTKLLLDFLKTDKVQNCRRISKYLLFFSYQNFFHTILTKIRVPGAFWIELKKKLKSRFWAIFCDFFQILRFFLKIRFMGPIFKILYFQEFLSEFSACTTKIWEMFWTFWK